MGRGKHIARTRTVRQLDPVECGAASLTMILRYYGEQVTLEQMRQETDVTRNGCAAGNLVRAAQARGFTCRGFRRSAQELKQIDPPCIIWWGANHFVVLEGIDGETCYLNDPDLGRRKMPFREFETHYSGIVLTFEPPEGRPVQRQAGPGADSLRRAYRILKQEGPAAAAALLAAALAGGCAAAAVLALVIPGAGGQQILPGGEAAPGGRPHLLFAVCFAAAAVICWIIRTRRTERLRDSVEIRGAYRFLQSLFSLPIAFYDQRYPSDLIRRMRANDSMDRFIAADLIDAAACALIAAAGLLIYVPAAAAAGTPGPAAAVQLLLLLCAVAAGIALRLCQRQVMLLQEAENSVREIALARVVFSGIGRTMTLKETGMTGAFADRAASIQADMIRDGSLSRRKRNILTGCRYAAYAVCLAAALPVWREHGMPGAEPALPVPGDMGGALLTTALFVIVIGCTEAAMSRYFRMLRLEEGMESVEDICRMAAPRSADEAESGAGFRKLQGRITLEEAAFSYQRSGAPVFAPVSMEIPSGSMIAVTGSPGSGRSTFALMAGGLLQPVQGRILYDGKPLAQIPSRVIHASIAAVGQDPRLFAGTVRDNITMWNPNITEQSIRKAAEDACIDEVIRARRGGYGYRIGEGGAGFSGGEQQRIAIAGALAVNPSILILDEATAGLDDETAMQIVRNIRRRGCTCILITRSRALMKYCDQVLPLDGREQDV